MKTKEIEKQLKQSLKKDFDGLYVKEFTTRWREERFVRGMELDIMSLENTAKLISTLRQSVLEEVREKMPKKTKRGQLETLDDMVGELMWGVDCEYDKDLKKTITSINGRFYGSLKSMLKKFETKGYNEYHDQVTSLINNLIEEK